MGFFSGLLGTDTGLKKGDTAPDFTLENQRGESVSLADFRGQKNLVIYFYPKDDTPGCTAESCAFRDQFEVFTDAGAEVIGISGDSVESHARFAEKHRLPFTLLSDPGNSVRKAFKVPATMGMLPGRVTFVVDKQGVIQHGFSSQINPVKHVQESLDVLKKLG